MSTEKEVCQICGGTKEVCQVCGGTRIIGAESNPGRRYCPACNPLGGSISPPYFPPQSEAAEMADDITAFANRYPLMWSTTHRKLLEAAESLRRQVNHGYIGGPPK